MKKALKFTLVLLHILLGSTAANAVGFMQIRNFAAETYKGGPQNWTAIQDSVGRLYVGNRDGMLSFDGSRWSKYVVPNLTTVRSLLYDDSTGRIYVGASEEFGYFAPDSISGDLAYHTLLDRFSGPVPHISEVWRIFDNGHQIFFQSDNTMLVFDGSTVRAAECKNRISCSALIDGHVFVGFENGTLAELEGLDYIPFYGLEPLGGHKIIAILSNGESLIIATPLDGLFLIHDGRADRFKTDIDSFITDNQLFCALNHGADYVFGTVTGGAVIKNFITGSTRYVNRESGLQNNTVLNAMFDKAGNIWLCLDNGLDYAIYNSPVSNLIGTVNGVGAGYASIKCGPIFYFGTNQGLYSTPYPFLNSPSQLDLKRELPGQIWDLTAAGDGFFVAGDAGVFFFNGRFFDKISDITGSYTVKTLRGNPATAIAASYDGYHFLHQHDNGRWHNVGLIADDCGVRGRFCEDADGTIWVGHWLKGVYRLNFNREKMAFERVTLFNDKNGLATTENNAVSMLDGEVVFFSPGGFFRFDNATSTIVPHPGLTDRFPGAKPRLLYDDGTRFVVMQDSILSVCHNGPDGEIRSETIRIKSLASKMLSGYENVNFVSPREIVVGNQNGFWDINPQSYHSNAWAAKPFVSAVYANSDTLVYRSGLRSGQNADGLILPYRLNSLRFEFACPDYSSDVNVVYSSMLENYDKTWSTPGEDSSREYTRLSEGNYTLHVRANNILTGQTAETSFKFRILSPWYRSVTAKIIYVLLAIAVFAALCIVVQRWKTNTERAMERKKETELEKMRQEAEQENIRKDYEIATLKSEQLEIDIKHKSSELGNATMNLMRKNEILQKIARRIAKIKEMTEGDNVIQKQLSHLQSLIEENISHDDDWSTFNRNFDIVYGNYTKRLHEVYPQLTQADIRLCCYIKMGLSSKEIAPLINISFKSVEMARYRLRKKINLPSEVSLTDFLTKF